MSVMPMVPTKFAKWDLRTNWESEADRSSAPTTSFCWSLPGRDDIARFPYFDVFNQKICKGATFTLVLADAAEAATEDKEVPAWLLVMRYFLVVPWATLSDGL